MRDVNDTRWRLFTSQRDWRDHLPGAPGSESVNVAWHAATRSLGLRQEQFQFPTPTGASLLAMRDRRGAAADRYANLYWLDDASTGIRVRAPSWTSSVQLWPVAASCAQTTADFSPTESTEEVPLQLRGLAVTADHFLVVGVLAPSPGLLILDLHAGGPPTYRHWPDALDGRPFQPWAIAARPGGGVQILDLADEVETPHEASGLARLWTLDGHLRIEGEQFAPGEPPDFQPIDEPIEPKPVRTVQAIDLDEVVGRAPIAISVSADDSVFIVWTSLDEVGSELSRRVNGVLSATILLDQPTDVSFDGESWRPHDGVFRDDPTPVTGELNGRLYVVGQDGNQSYVYDVVASEDSLQATIELEYLPMRRFSGKGLVGCALGADCDWPTGVLYDINDRWAKLVAHPRPRFATHGVLEMVAEHALDSGSHGCVWHRILLDAHLPPGTSITIQSRAADRLEDLDGCPWSAEPAPYLKHTGSEIPHVRSVVGACDGQKGAGTWETLLQHAVGRYLQLRMALTGPGRASPRIYAMRVHTPRFSYLERYLPDVYRQDPTSAHFLERFLANIEGMSTELEGRVAEAQSLFDERTVDAEYLDWLASWIGVTLDPSWDETRRRLFLAHAPQMFRQRGTLLGLARAIRLSISPCVDETLFDDDTLANDVGARTGCSSTSDPFGVRLIESWIMRAAPGVVFGDPEDAMSPSYTVDEWTPADGAAELHSRWRTYLAAVYADDAALRAAWTDDSIALATVRFPPLAPANAIAAADWRTFTTQSIGFTYAEPTPDDDTHWRVFLAARYRTASAISQAYQAQIKSFNDIGLPETLPSGTELIDWIQFVSLTLPIRRAAHRFVVLVPTQGDSADKERQRVDLVRRIVEIEKPAHTSADVRPYWAAFRVGSARVGLDTLIDRGSRYSAITLGSTGLGLGYAMHAHPFDVTDRYVVGREKVNGGGEV